MLTPNSSTTAIHLKEIAVRFGKHNVIQNIDLKVQEGEFVAVVGPTGCGKSTLLNIITGLLNPTAGEVLIFDKQLTGLNSAAGYMLQQDALLPWKTALDNVGLGLMFQGMKVKDARAQAKPWLKKIGLAGFEAHYPHQLSGGMKKRVSMAQMLILSPKIVLMDEPFSALDIHNRHLMQNELLRLWQEDRKSLVFITHDLEEAITLADRVIILSAGPASQLIGNVPIALARPRNASEINMTDEFIQLYRKIWSILGAEVEKSYASRD